MVQGKWFAPGAELGDAEEVRKSVFGTGADTLDAESWNVLVFLDGQPAACGRIRWCEGDFVLEDIGVLPALRGKRLGDLVLRLLLFKAQEHGARRVVLTSPEDTAGFFERLGFRGDTAQDGSLTMHLAGEEIDLDTCRGCKKKDCPNRKEA